MFCSQDEGPSSKGESFFVLQENHHLIGVANVFLEVLFYDAKLEYHVPIISQQGEVSLIGLFLDSVHLWNDGKI